MEKKISEKLYKRNAKGDILVWSIAECTDGALIIQHGKLGCKERPEVIEPTKKRVSEFDSRIKAKRKEGYKSLSDLYDNSPVEESMIEGTALYKYLDTYLPKNNTTSEGFVFPMLAKTLVDNKPFEKIGTMLGQWKINGLRCVVGAERDNANIFNSIKLTYTSREGTRWNLSWMDDIILPKIQGELLDMMVEGVASLDGELYLPGYSVNDINSFVKNSALVQHYLLQYWCYDICVEAYTTVKRNNIIRYNIDNDLYAVITSNEALMCNEEQFVLLPSVPIDSISQAIEVRDRFINIGFEGLILRNPNAEYAFGKRNSSMFKYKKKFDGLFTIEAIYEDKRGLPIFVLKNDINDSEFECTLNAPHEVQRNYLAVMQTLIGKKGLVEFRERSGVKNVPFHAKLIKVYV